MSNWPLQSECLAKFGNPTAKNFRSNNLVWVKPKFEMKMGDIDIEHFLVNKICAESLNRILNKAWDKCNKDQKLIDKERISYFSGTWAVRNMRGGKAISTHAYGLAIDFNAAENPLGVAPGTKKNSFTKNSLLVKLFEEEGWVWGGRWRGRPDGMHFRRPS